MAASKQKSLEQTRFENIQRNELMLKKLGLLKDAKALSPVKEKLQRTTKLKTTDESENELRRSGRTCPQPYQNIKQVVVTTEIPRERKERNPAIFVMHTDEEWSTNEEERAWKQVDIEPEEIRAYISNISPAHNQMISNEV